VATLHGYRANDLAWLGVGELEATIKTQDRSKSSPRDITHFTI